MSINLISTPSIIKVGPRKGQKMYTTRVAHYSTIDAEAVIDYASEIGLLPRGILRAAWDVMGDVIQQLVLHGHIVQIPGVGNIRAEVRAKAQAEAADVTPECVTHRKLMLTPNTKIRAALKGVPMTVSVIEEPAPEPVAETPETQELPSEPSPQACLSPEPHVSPAAVASANPEPQSDFTDLCNKPSAPHHTNNEATSTTLSNRPTLDDAPSPNSDPIVIQCISPSAAVNTLLNKSPPQIGVKQESRVSSNNNISFS